MITGIKGLQPSNPANRINFYATAFRNYGEDATLERNVIFDLILKETAQYATSGYQFELFEQNPKNTLRVEITLAELQKSVRNLERYVNARRRKPLSGFMGWLKNQLGYAQALA